jgi:cytochrome c
MSRTPSLTLRPVFILLVCAVVAACSAERAPQDKSQIGDLKRGRELIERYGCGTCHAIPNIAGAHGSVGPPLAGIASRSYLGGVLANTPRNMTRWIREPQVVDPRTAMPNLGISESEARDIAAYLYTLT